MADAKGASRGRYRSRSQISINSVQRAVMDKDVPKARNMIGHLIRPECHCPPRQGRCRPADLPKHCRKKPNTYKNVLKQLRKVLDEDELDTLLGVTGDVSLIFVMDTTGSMSDEIEAAKNISKAIAAYPRESSVNYILSPFSDPTWGNVYKCPNQDSFMEALDTLTAHGGRDCPELTFNGIIDAIELGDPIVGSPMFVFTDAGAKEGDDLKYTLDNALGLALKYMIPVNFFYSTEFGSCGSFDRHSSLVDLLDGTDGFGMQFNSSGEIQKMSGVMAAALDGTSTILEGRSSGDRGRRHSRSAIDKIYRIPVDNTVQTLIVTFVAWSNPNLVELRNPNELPQPRTENLAQGGVWLLRSPTRGEWSFYVPAAVGTHTFKVQSGSRFNLEFDFFFHLKKEIGGQLFEDPIDYPLLGDISTVNLIIPLKKRLNLTSLGLTLVDKSGRHLENVNLVTSNLVGTFIPPLAPFKLKLSGSTAEGHPFQRISPKFVTAKNVLLRLQGGQRYNTLQCGRTLRLSFVLDYNGESGESFGVTVNSSLVMKTSSNTTTTAIQARYRRIVKNRLRDPEVFFTVWLKTPRDVTDILDKWNTMKVTVKRRSGNKVGSAVSQADMTSYTNHFKVTCPIRGP